MTREQQNVEPGRRHAPPTQTPRLRLKPKAPPSGYVDGAWWPQSDDLTTELPDLLAVLSVRLGTIGRVIFKIDEWATAPAKLVIDGRSVPLDGYGSQPGATVEVLGLNRDKMVLLVVSPHTDPEQAHAIMMMAAGPNNALAIDDLLHASAGVSE